MDTISSWRAAYSRVPDEQVFVDELGQRARSQGTPAAGAVIFSVRAPGLT
ncbi:hypothetical protein [Pseudonocardia sp.]|jgi:hypothetical protein